MPVRQVKREEMMDLEKMAAVAFVFEFDEQKTVEALEKEPEPEKYCIANFNDEGQMMAAMGLPEYEMRYDGHTVKMTGIGGVTTLPEYRFGGAIRQLFELAFSKMIEGGAVFSALYPFSHIYYRKFGYELIEPTREVWLPTVALRGYRQTGWARMLGKGEVPDDVKRLHKLCYAGYNGAIVRGDEQWKQWADRDPYKQKHYRYLLGNDSGAIAYCVIEAKKLADFDHAAHVREIAFDGREGLHAILGFLFRFEAQYSKVRLQVPPGVPIHAMVEESYQLEDHIESQPMFRVMDAAAALELMKQPDGASYTIEIRDELVLKNNGVFRVVAGGDKASVERLPDGSQADIEVDIRTFAQLCLGYIDLDEAMMKPDVVVRGNEDVLRQVFGHKKFLLTDHF